MNINFKVDTWAYKEAQEIHQKVFTSVNDHLHKEVLRLKEEAVRKALIELGWTPPVVGGKTGNTVFISDERITELAKQAQENIAIKANDDYDTRWWKPELYDQEFARLIIQEVIKYKEENNG